MKKVISLIMIVALMIAAVVGAFSVSAVSADPLMITDYESVATGAIAGDWQDDNVTNNFTSSIIDSGAIDGTKCLSITANTVGDGPICFWTPEKGFSTNDFSAGGAALGVRMRVQNLSDKESFAVGFTFDGGRDIDPQQYVRVIPVKADGSTALKLVDMDGNEVTPPSVTGVLQMGDAGYAVSLPANFDGWLVMPYADCQLQLLADITGVGVKDDIVSLDKVPDYAKNLINYYYTVNADADQLGTTVLIDDLQVYEAPAAEYLYKVVSDLENVKNGTDLTAALNTDKPWDANAFASVYGAANPAFMDIDSTNPLSGKKSLSIGLTKLVDSYYACYWGDVASNTDFQMKDLVNTPNQIKARVKNTSATAASPFFAPLVEVKTLAGGAAFALLAGTETQSFIQLYDKNGNKVAPAGYAACYPGSDVLAGVSLPAGFDGYIVCDFSQGSVYYKSNDDAASLDLLGNASMKIGDTVPYADFVQADADKVADVAFTMSATTDSQLNNPILVDDIGLYGVAPTITPSATNSSVLVNDGTEKVAGTGEYAIADGSQDWSTSTGYAVHVTNGADPTSLWTKLICGSYNLHSASTTAVRLYDNDFQPVDTTFDSETWGADAPLVIIPANFDGWVVVDFSSGLPTEGYNSLIQRMTSTVTSMYAVAGNGALDSVSSIYLYQGDFAAAMVAPAQPTVAPTVAPTDETTVAPTATENPNANTADAGLLGIIATAAVSGFAIYRKRK